MLGFRNRMHTSESHQERVVFSRIGCHPKILTMMISAVVLVWEFIFEVVIVGIIGLWGLHQMGVSAAERGNLITILRGLLYIHKVGLLLWVEPHEHLLESQYVRGVGKLGHVHDQCRKV